MINSEYKPTNIDNLEAQKVNYNGFGVNTLVAAGSTQNIDFPITDDILLWGGQRLIKDAAFGDKIDVQIVVTASGTIPNGAGGFLPAGTVVRQFYTNWYVSEGTSDHEFLSPCPRVVSAGFTIRYIYHSVGSTDVQLSVNLHTFYILV
jgi:hypothetical protein